MGESFTVATRDALASNVEANSTLDEDDALELAVDEVGAPSTAPGPPSDDAEIASTTSWRRAAGCCDPSHVITVEQLIVEP